MSEAGPQTLRRAAKVHPIARAPERVFAVDARSGDEQGFGDVPDWGLIVAYSRWGGIFDGKSRTDGSGGGGLATPESEVCGDAFEKNLKLAEHVKALAKRRDARPQLALAWVLARGRTSCRFRGPSG